MPTFDVPTLGAIDFPTGTDGYWSFELPLRGGDVEVDINIDSDELTREMFEEVKDFIADAVRFDEISRDALKADYVEKPEGQTSTYLSHHAEELGEKEVLKIFGVDDADEITIDHLLDALRLERIGLYPGADGYVAVFDYSIDVEATDYIMAVEFDSDGELFGISMDS